MYEKLPELPVIPDTADISDQTPEQSARIIESLPLERQKKVLEVREQLVKGTYNPGGRMGKDFGVRKV